MIQVRGVSGGLDVSGVMVPLVVLVGAGILSLIAVSLVVVLLVRRRSEDRRPVQYVTHRSRVRLLGDVLLVAGAALLVVAAVSQFSDLGGGDTVLPAPVALGAPGPYAATDEPSSVALGAPSPHAAAEDVSPTPDATPEAEISGANGAMAASTATASPTATLPPVATPGVPVRMVIPSIGVDSGVQEAGTVWVDGELQYETLPYLIAHYRTTAKAGAPGNAVFSGHVTTRSYGNVFRDLYRIQVGDTVEIYSDLYRYVYVVSNVRDVLPTDIGVMDPTVDATITLITCSGEWIPEEHQYTRRLVVTAKLQSAEPLSRS